MISTNEISKIDWSLYGILDTSFLNGRSVAEIADQMIAGGVTVVQLRNKSGNIREFYAQALQVRTVTLQSNIPFIINDRLDVAMAVAANGVHLGQNDLPSGPVRKALGENAIVGLSVHNLDEFENCDLTSVTYLGVGTIFSTTTKADLKPVGAGFLKRLRTLTAKPLIAIGGITPDNFQEAFQAGADGVAVISSLITAQDISKAAAGFRRKLAVTK